MSKQKPNEKATGARPTHKLKFLNRTTGEKGYLGAGWLNADGSIGIKLNAMVVIHAAADLVLTLFPADADYDNDGRAGGVEKKADDIPF